MNTNSQNDTGRAATTPATDARHTVHFNLPGFGSNLPAPATPAPRTKPSKKNDRAARAAKQETAPAPAATPQAANEPAPSPTVAPRPQVVATPAVQSGPKPGRPRKAVTASPARRGGRKIGKTPVRLPLHRQAGPVGLAEAVDAVLAAWRSQALGGAFSLGTVEKYGEVLSRFTRFCAANGVTTVEAVDEAVVVAFARAALPSGPGRSPSLTGQAPANGTVAVRVTAVKNLFHTLNDAGVTDAEPAKKVAVGAQRRTRLRPATPAQMSAIQDYAEAHPEDTMRPAALALMMCGASVVEVAFVRVRDVDLTSGTITLPGCTGQRIMARTVRPGLWEQAAIERRVQAIQAEAGHGDDVSDCPLAFHRPPGTYKNNHISQTVGALIRKMINGSGNHVSVTGLTPMSVTQYAVNNLYAQTGDIEQVAALYGIKSLDRARALISREWQYEHGDGPLILAVLGESVLPHAITVGSAS